MQDEMYHLLIGASPFQFQAMGPFHSYCKNLLPVSKSTSHDLNKSYFAVFQMKNFLFLCWKSCIGSMKTKDDFRKIELLCGTFLYVT